MPAADAEQDGMTGQPATPMRPAGEMQAAGSEQAAGPPDPGAPQRLEPPPYPGWPQPPRHPRPVWPADLRMAVAMLAVVALLGLPLGWLWSSLAPAQLSLVQPDGTLTPLPTESQHRFDDLALFVLLGGLAGLLAGLAAWLLRRRRGPLTLLALAAGSLAAAWLAARAGVYLADAGYSDAGRQAGAVVPVAPRLESAWAVVVQPLLAVLAYGVFAAGHGGEELGRDRSDPSSS